MADDAGAIEAARLDALRALDVLDTPPEPVFDRLAAVAASVFRAPVALVSFVDEHRQWFKACIGFHISETGRDLSFCAHAIMSDEVMVVPDATADPRFADNPAVTQLGLRFYAGAPMHAADGSRLGTVCVIDITPRPAPDEEQLRALAELAAVASDVLELRLDAKAQAQVQANNARLAAIVDSSDDAILSTSLDGVITSWNAGATKLYGYAADEVVGQHISLLVPGDRVGEVDIILAGVRRGESVQRLETVRLAKDGHVIPVSLTVSPIVDATGRVLGKSTIARDITERQRLQAELMAARDAAMESSRLKTEFLATMSHEIRTPMNGVIGMTGLLLETDLDDEQRDYAATVRASGEALLTIINDILDFSKIEAGKLGLEAIDFDLRVVVDEVAELLAEPADVKGLELVTLVEADVPSRVRGDPGRLRQVLLNLVGNAIKFTERGDVMVRASVEAAARHDVLVRFDVRDTGIGIDPAATDRLFQPFAQADASTTRVYGGTGLGLAISHQLVDMMGGDLSVRSEPGRGSTFTFTVRLATRGPVEPVVPRDDLRALRALIVDDNATNRRILEHQVRSWGMRLDSVDGGRAALDILRDAAATGDPFDVVLLDMEMPDLDGLEVARSVRADAALGQTRLVLLTSWGVRGAAESARGVGIDAYLTKPVSGSQLHETLAMVTTLNDSGPEFLKRHSLAEAHARARPRLLVAEDNAVNQKVVAAMVAKLGYRADVVANGAEAVEAVGRIRYAAVLMDCQMPEMDGYAATAAIRASEHDEAHTPIIALTAAAMQGDAERCLAAGMDDYVAKPIMMDALEAVLRRWAPQPSAD